MRTLATTASKKKLHPHLKAFIHSTIMSESGLGPSKNYVWKEFLMRQVQTAVLDRLEEISSQGDLERIALEEVQKVQKDFVRTLDMVGRTLAQVPVAVLKNG